MVETEDKHRFSRAMHASNLKMVDALVVSQILNCDHATAVVTLLQLQIGGKDISQARGIGSGKESRKKAARKILAGKLNIRQ